MIKLENIGIENLDKPMTWADWIKAQGGYVEDYPLIGKTACLDGERIAEYDVKGEGNIDIVYEWVKDTGRIIRIYIGHKYAGPMLEWARHRNGDKGSWINLYSKHNYGKNWASGGTWSSDTNLEYETPLDALTHRTYMVKGICMERNMYMESKLLLDEVRKWLENLMEKKDDE